MKLKMLAPWKKSYDQHSILKSRDMTLLTKVHLVKAMVFSSSHVWMWELDYKESWVPKNWCFWTVVLEKTLESPLDCKEIQPVHPKGDQSWVFIGGTDIEAKTPILWPMRSTDSKTLDYQRTNPSVQFSLVIQSCPTLCESMNCSTPGLPVHHQLLESTQTHVHCVGDAI